MSVRLWAYEPEKCDGEFCYGNCDNCEKAEIGEHIPLWLAMAMLKREGAKNGTNAEENDN